MDDDLTLRLERIYSSINAAIETDFSKMTPEILDSGNSYAVFQDFSGGLTEPEVANIVVLMIHNIGALRDHLKVFAEEEGKKVGDVNRVVRDCEALRIIIDLWNGEKHGYPLTNSMTGRQPKIKDVNRVMRLQTGPTRGSSAMMTLDTTGRPVIRSSGGGLVKTH